VIVIPFLGTLEMDNGPTDVAGPDVRLPEDFVRAHCTLVVSMADILMNPGSKVCGG
jgi:hypothetical protein